MPKHTKILFALLIVTAIFIFAQTSSAADWQSAAIDKTGDVGQYTSITSDSNNKVYIAYYDNTSDDLKYITNTSGSWVATVIDSSGDVGKYSSIVIDSDDKVHISYYDADNNYLKYATNATPTGAWQTSMIDSNNLGDWVVISGGIAIAVDSDKKAHIAYLDETNDDLKYATNSSGTWQISVLDNNIGGAFGWFLNGGLSITVDSNKKVHISYTETTNNDLKYITNASGSWASETIDSSSAITVFSSIYLDSNNKVHISYYDNTNNDLKYATNSSGSWQISTLDSNGDVGMGSSLKLDSNSKAHISYYDVTNQDLKYITNVSGSWQAYILDSTDVVGSYNSLVTDSNNRVHISYYDNTNDDLKYIYSPAPSSSYIVINSDDSYTVSRNAALNLSAQGSPTEMIISENSDFASASWETYSASKSFTLSSGQAMKTVYAKFRDQWYAESNVASDAINYLTKPKFVTKNKKNLEILVNKKNQEYKAPDLTFLFSKLPSKFLSKKYYLQIQKRAKYMKKYDQDKKITLKKYWRFETNFNKYRPKSPKKDFKMTIVFQYSDAEVAALKKIDKNIKEKNLFLLRYNFSKKTWEKIMTDHSKKNNTFTLSGLKPSDFSDEFYYFAIGKK